VKVLNFWRGVPVFELLIKEVYSTLEILFGNSKMLRKIAEKIYCSN